MAKELKDLNIAIATHEYFKGTGQELKDFLVECRVSRVFYVAHLFPFVKDSISYLEDYHKGSLEKKLQSPLLPKNDFLLYLRDIFYTFKFFLFDDGKFDFYIGVDSFNAILGLVLKKFGKVNTVAFMTIDYVMQKRFKWALLNWIYVKMDRIAFYGSDFTWNVSDRMSRQRIVELGEKAKSKVQLIVPIGVPIEEAEKIQVERKDNVIVYSGGLLPEYGLELIVESMPALVKLFPGIELRIIGEGELGQKLRGMAADLKVSQNTNFVGYINTNTDRERWLRLLKESTLGLATYEPSETTYKRFSDVTKPKDYMSCGLPIITTSVIPFSEDIQKHNLGRVVEYNVDSFVASIRELLENKEELGKIRANVYRFCKDMTWENIFKRVFSEMGVLV